MFWVVHLGGLYYLLIASITVILIGCALVYCRLCELTCIVWEDACDSIECKEKLVNVNSSSGSPSGEVMHPKIESR